MQISFMRATPKQKQALWGNGGYVYEYTDMQVGVADDQLAALQAQLELQKGENNSYYDDIAAQVYVAKDRQKQPCLKDWLPMVSVAAAVKAHSWGWIHLIRTTLMPMSWQDRVCCNSLTIRIFWHSPRQTVIKYLCSGTERRL